VRTTCRTTDASSPRRWPRWRRSGQPWLPRVKHLALNKDKGTIDPTIGAGATDRGRIKDNFRYAVQAAIADSKDK
jgi:hypothetical protein